MSYLEELLPEFRKGAKIRKKKWGKSDYLYCKDGIVYDRSNQTVYNLCTESLSYDGWEFYKDPEPNWQYIIENKCLCWFWDNCDKEDRQRARCLSDFIPNKTTPFLDEAGYFWPYCRPVRKDEVTFYEDKK